MIEARPVVRIPVEPQFGYLDICVAQRLRCDVITQLLVNADEFGWAAPKVLLRGAFRRQALRPNCLDAGQRIRGRNNFV